MSYAGYIVAIVYNQFTEIVGQKARWESTNL